MRRRVVAGLQLDDPLPRPVGEHRVGVELDPRAPGRRRSGRCAAGPPPAESSPTSTRCSISMPNGVPQSPTWLSLIRWSPTNSVTRAIASPTIVVRRWPTCISLAMFGEEYSTMTVCGCDGQRRRRARGSASSSVAASAIHCVRSVRLTKPGPLTVGGSAMSSTSRWRDDLARDVARRLAEPLGQRQRDVGLEVARTRTGGSAGPRQRSPRRTRLRGRRAPVR